MPLHRLLHLLTDTLQLRLPSPKSSMWCAISCLASGSMPTSFSGSSGSGTAVQRYASSWSTLNWPMRASMNCTLGSVPSALTAEVVHKIHARSATTDCICRNAIMFREASNCATKAAAMLDGVMALDVAIEPLHARLASLAQAAARGPALTGH
jgi:hypothetical protein